MQSRRAELLAADLRELVRVEPDAATLRALVYLDGDHEGELATRHHDVRMVWTRQPDGVVNEGRGKLLEMSHECVTERALRMLKPGEFEPIQPKAATVFTQVGVDAADP